MSSTGASDAPFQLLQACIDPDGSGDIRILVGRTTIKYIVFDSGVFDAEDLSFEPSLLSILPPLPEGDWNEAVVSHDPKTGSASFSRAHKVELAGIDQLWHPLVVDYLDLRIGKKLRSNVYEAESNTHRSSVIAKFARFSWEVPLLEAETRAYQRIQGHGVGPEFLGHITEHGRAIGFIMTNVAGAHAAPKDLARCRRVLQRLHGLGLKHGDINRHNFLVSGDTATLIDFDCVSPAPDDDLKKELQSLEDSLADESGRGGVSTL